MTLLIVLAVVVVLGIVGVVLYNKLAKLNVNVDEGFAQIEVQLKRRADLIPNLVETVKGYATHERSTLEAVTAARGAAVSAQGVQAVAAADGQVTSALRGLLAVAESYPDLQASANFAQLQEELAATENRVAFARQFYNENVRNLNTAVATVPTNLVAKVAKVTKREFYEVQDPTDRIVPKVSF